MSQTAFYSAALERHNPTGGKLTVSMFCDLYDDVVERYDRYRSAADVLDELAESAKEAGKWASDTTANNLRPWFADKIACGYPFASVLATATAEWGWAPVHMYLSGATKATDTPVGEALVNPEDWIEFHQWASSFDGGCKYRDARTYILGLDNKSKKGSTFHGVVVTRVLNRIGVICLTDQGVPTKQNNIHI